MLAFAFIKTFKQEFYNIPMNHPPCKTIESPAPEGQLKIFRNFLMVTAHFFESTLSRKRSLRFLHYLALFALYPNPFFCIFELNAAPVNLSEATKVNEIRFSTIKNIAQLCWYDMYVHEFRWRLLFEISLAGRGYNDLHASEKTIFDIFSKDPEFIAVAKEGNPRERSNSSWARIEPNYLKTLGNQSRLKDLSALLKNVSSQHFPQEVIDLIKINLIQEHCALGSQIEGSNAWKTLDQERYTNEWMQWQFLICVAKSTNDKNRHLIDAYIKTKPEMMHGYIAKLADICVVTPKNKEMLRSQVRDLVKFILLKFEIDANFKSYSIYFDPINEHSTHLTQSQAFRLFKFLCEISVSKEAQEVSDFAEKFQNQNFFESPASAPMKKGMISVYETLLKSTEQKGDINIKIFESFGFNLLK